MKVRASNNCKAAEARGETGGDIGRGVSISHANLLLERERANFSLARPRPKIAAGIAPAMLRMNFRADNAAGENRSRSQPK